jgi:hypothetical protein
MDRGWVKQWRKEIDSVIWGAPPLYYKIWRWVLMSADKRTGTLEKSYSQIAKAVEYKENRRIVIPHKMSIKRALEWMESQKMLVTTCDGQLVMDIKKISICNWDTYQSSIKQLVTTCDGQLVTAPINKEVQEVQDKEKPFMSANANVQKIFDLYQTKIKSTSRLTDSAKKKIQTRLIFFSVDELKNAITNFSKSGWWMEKNSHRGMAWFFNSDDRIDGFLNLEPDVPQKSETFDDDLYERFSVSGEEGSAPANLTPPQTSAPSQANKNGMVKIGSPPPLTRKSQ